MPNFVQQINQGLQGAFGKSTAVTNTQAGPPAPNMSVYKPAPVVPTATPTTPKVSTTTISNQNKINNVPKLITQTNTLADKGVRTDPKTGIATLANGNAAPEPEKLDSNGLLINPPGALYDRNTGKLLKQPKADAPKLTNPDDNFVTPDTTFEDDQIMRNLNEMQSQNDAATSSLIANIQQKFAQRKQEQTDINMKANKATENALLMGGVTGKGSSAQYAPVSSQGIITGQESYGIKQLAALDSEENDLIAAAKYAQMTGNFKVLEAKNKEIEKKRQEKIDVATKLNEDIAKRNNEARTAQIQATRDTAVADLVAQGVTDPTEILKSLNETGGDFTAKEIKETLSNIATTNNTDLKGLSADVQEFYRLKAEPNGLPVSILHLPDTASQIAAYLKIKAGAKKTSSSGGGVTYSQDENGNLIAVDDYSALDIGRYNRAANAATKILQSNPTFKNIIGSSAYLDRIEAAIQNPGSVGDQELLDAFTQLNTGGNRVTEAQVRLITENQSLSDTLNKIGNKLKTGGALSAAQRTEIVNLAHEVYKNYQISYKPLYEDAIKKLKAQGIPEQFWNIPSPDTLSRAVSDQMGGSLGGSAPDDFLNSPIPGNTGEYDPSVWGN